MMNQIRKIYSKISLKNAKDLKKREEGISALVTVRNEPWLEPSLLSIDKIVDEIIIIDSSTSDITELVKRIDKKVSAKVKFHHMPPYLTKQTEKAIELSSKKWLLRWDADFIAYTSGEKDISKINKIISRLDDNKHYLISFNLIDLGDSFFSTSPTQKELFHTEPYLFSYSKDLIRKKRPIRRAIRFLKLHINHFGAPPRLIQHPLPLYYKPISIETPLAIHLRGIKPSSRKKEKKFQSRWANLSEEEKKEYSYSLEKFIKYGSSNRYTRAETDNIEKFNYKKWRYPAILKKWLKENLDLKIEKTKEFEKEIDKYISKFEE